MSAGLIIAAPSSGSGKTTVTLGLLRALKRAGLRPASAKAGPDYVDPGFHAAASGVPCLNLDIWAMRDATLEAVARRQLASGTVVIAEGVMGLFDGATPERGSTADLAARTGWPVVLVVDAGGMSASIAALVQGFARYRDGVHVVGVIANRTGSARHAELLAEALASIDIPLLGHLPRDSALQLPSRHLGLVLAAEHAQLEAFLERAADAVDEHVDVARLVSLARPLCKGVAGDEAPVAVPPPGACVAVARDDAFAFVYDWTLNGWGRAGAEVKLFSPLADEAPDVHADAVYLPGGYPELHAGRLAANARFLAGVRDAGARGATVFGECGGYMVMGECLHDADDVAHAMLGLLPLTTSFATRRMSLGYRRAVLRATCALGARGAAFNAHEFHFAQTVRSGAAEALFDCTDARAQPAGQHGLARGNVFGSFIHLIDAAD